MRTSPTFRYEGLELDADGTLLRCRYSLDGYTFIEHFELDVPPEAHAGPAPTEVVQAAARLVYLLAGVSYYKAMAPPVIDLGECGATGVELAFLRRFYVEGLGEFAFRNNLDLSGLRIEAAGFSKPAIEAAGDRGTKGGEPRALVPFGGGIDSIVTVEEVRQRASGLTLMVVAPGGRRLAAIEEPAAVTGLPVVRVARYLDAQVLSSEAFGFLNGHVPVTGILSAVAVWAAARSGHDAVVMSNEWSASFGNLEVSGRTVNHQYSKSLGFENGLRGVLTSSIGDAVDYFSYLRARSELWVAQRFSRLASYHDVFRSCNRAFHVDPAARLDAWCGICDKCCFIDLVLAPFLDASRLAAIFGGHEPLQDPALTERFRTLLGTTGSAKPFDCVGEPGECRAAAVLAAARPDRAGSALLQRLATEAVTLLDAQPEAYLAPMGSDHVPDALAPQDLLV